MDLEMRARRERRGEAKKTIALVQNEVANDSESVLEKGGLSDGGNSEVRKLTYADLNTDPMPYP